MSNASKLVYVTERTNPEKQGPDLSIVSYDVSTRLEAHCGGSAMAASSAQAPSSCGRSSRRAPCLRTHSHTSAPSCF